MSPGFRVTYNKNRFIWTSKTVFNNTSRSELQQHKITFRGVLFCWCVHFFLSPYWYSPHICKSMYNLVFKNFSGFSWIFVAHIYVKTMFHYKIIIIIKERNVSHAEGNQSWNDTVYLCLQYGVSSSGGVCEPITIPMCQGLSYNQTLIPNLLGHTSQREAFTKMSFFNSMVQTVCSVDIRVFLCRVYAPQCEAGQAQWPCRSFCEKARRDCEGLMSNFGISWPEELQCSSFPEEMCISVSNRQFVDDQRNIKNVI